MPVDKNGQELQKGDIVMVPCKVMWVFDQEGGSNVNLRTLVLHPDDQEPIHFACHASQVEKQ